MPAFELNPNALGLVTRVAELERIAIAREQLESVNRATYEAVVATAPHPTQPGGSCADRHIEGAHEALEPVRKARYSASHW